MNIYVSSDVQMNEDKYVNFLLSTCDYNNVSAEIKRWEVDYQIRRRCIPTLMKPLTSGVLKFKTVLQKQEINRIGCNYDELIKLIKRRRGNKGNTQWEVGYVVSANQDVFITSIKCYNTFSGSINESVKQKQKIVLKETQLRMIIQESIKKILNII